MHRFLLIINFALIIIISVHCNKSDKRINFESDNLSDGYLKTLLKYQINDLEKNSQETLRLFISGNDINKNLDFHFVIIDFIKGHTKDSIILIKKMLNSESDSLLYKKFEVKLPTYFFESFNPILFDSLNLCEYMSLIYDGQIFIYDYYLPEAHRIFFDRPIVRGARIHRLPKEDWGNMKLLDSYIDYIQNILIDKTGIDLNDFIGI